LDPQDFALAVDAGRTGRKAGYAETPLVQGLRMSLEVVLLPGRDDVVEPRPGSALIARLGADLARLAAGQLLYAAPAVVLSGLGLEVVALVSDDGVPGLGLGVARGARDHPRGGGQKKDCAGLSCEAHHDLFSRYVWMGRCTIRSRLFPSVNPRPRLAGAR